MSLGIVTEKRIIFWNFFQRQIQLKNYYAILGIKAGASHQEIRKAYKASVKKWHPDFHPNDPECLEKIKDINEAYEVLSHSTKRRAYHQRLKGRK
jgi:DnaJ-class molecular chaperone